VNVAQKGNKQNDSLFKREFSFTLPGDIYCRYLSFRNSDEFRQSLLSSMPDKIDIGAVFSMAPKHYKDYNVIGNAGTTGGMAFRPLERELVFDIDMDEYDDVRTCCKGAQVCKKCWTFIAAAVRCINETLRVDYGFKHIMFIFSGRRGVHCWVCDEAARFLSNEQRSAVAEYMQLVSGPKGHQLRATSNLRRKGMLQHPLIKRSVAICQEYFEKPEFGILDGQGVFRCQKDNTEEVLEQVNPNLLRIIRALPDDAAIRQDLPAFIRLAARDQRAAWKKIAEDINTAKAKRRNIHSIGTEDVFIEFTYPRLDINVSKQMNHLLKSPFCIHPKTGRVCVPILDPSRPEDFDPSQAPILSDVISGNAPDIQKYLDYFARFVNEVVADTQRIVKAEESQPMEF
jgi:DNA primase small subunit